VIVSSHFHNETLTGELQLPPDGGGDGSIIYAVLVRLDRIYTRAGDAGQTSLGDGERVSKNDARIWAYGTVDETGAAIGAAVAGGLPAEIADLLRRVQNDLFDVGADLAVPVGTTRGKGKSRLRIGEAHVAALEEACDRHSEALEPLTSFVLSGGTGAAAALHVARTTCRRAERCAVALAEHEEVNPASLAYLNRLSDLLFILARVANDGGRGDVLWQPGASVAPGSA
jgi:cob(I)alamin adenosyltransferase